MAGFSCLAGRSSLAASAPDTNLCVRGKEWPALLGMSLTTVAKIPAPALGRATRPYLVLNIEQAVGRYRTVEAQFGPRAVHYAGVAFHVGSQQRVPGRWELPIAQAARVFAASRKAGLRPYLLDIGGGLPAIGFLSGVSLDGGLVFVVTTCPFKRRTTPAGRRTPARRR
jgi:hypothetical protein